jgi:hypothetical protein
MAHYGVPGIPLVSEGSGPIPPVPFQTPQNIFRFGEQTLWSTQLLATTAAGIANQSLRMFTTPLGQVGQGFTNGLTIAETNLKEGGRVPAGVAYDVFGIATELTSSTALQGGGDVLGGAGTGISQQANTAALVADMLNVQRNSALSWDFTQTTVDICPVTLAGAGGGLFGAEATTLNNTSVGHMNNGNGQVWMYRKHPVALPGNSTFAILFRIGSRAANLNNVMAVRLTLMGYYKNVIEIG